jgi:hypothetical protein
VGEKPYEGFASTGPTPNNWPGPNQTISSNPDGLATSQSNRWFLFSDKSPRHHMNAMDLVRGGDDGDEQPDSPPKGSARWEPQDFRCSFCAGRQVLSI